MLILETIKVPAKIESLHQCMDFVASCAQKQGLDSRSINRIELATDEALVNIFNYAYSDCGGDVEISCMIDHNAMFVIEITDSGVPFNVLDAPDPDIAADIEQRKIGGLGIFMIKKIMDDVQYRRESGKNYLTLKVFKTGSC
jgi:anti-sigma regulatory factor (Ser/Thr protein kinase)